MEDSLLTILDSFGYPVFQQGSMSDKSAYPETMVTFWCNGSPDHAYYDNAEYGTAWSYNVYVYSCKADVVYSLIANIRAALKAAGWIVPSKGFDADSDEETHIGKGIECFYLDV